MMNLLCLFSNTCRAPPVGSLSAWRIKMQDTDDDDDGDEREMWSLVWLACQAVFLSLLSYERPTRLFGR